MPDLRIDDDLRAFIPPLSASTPNFWALLILAWLGTGHVSPWLVWSCHGVSLQVKPHLSSELASASLVGPRRVVAGQVLSRLIEPWNLSSRVTPRQVRSCHVASGQALPWNPACPGTPCQCLAGPVSSRLFQALERVVAVHVRPRPAESGQVMSRLILSGNWPLQCWSGRRLGASGRVGSRHPFSSLGTSPSPPRQCRSRRVMPSPVTSGPVAPCLGTGLGCPRLVESVPVAPSRVTSQQDLEQVTPRRVVSGPVAPGRVWSGPVWPTQASRGRSARAPRHLSTRSVAGQMQRNQLHFSKGASL